MDWITGLPPCGPMGYNSVFTVVNRTTQQVRILPCVLGAGEMSSEATAKLFLKQWLGFMGYLMKCCMIETQDSQQTSGVSSGSCWEAGQSSHQPTTHRLMEELRECIAPLSRPSDVCWLRETCLKSSGVNCWLMLSLPSTLPLLRVLGRFPQNLPLGSCHAHHLMWWSKLVAMLGLKTLSFTSRTCFREPRLTC